MSLTSEIERGGMHPDEMFLEWNIGGGGTCQQQGRNFEGISYYVPFLLYLEWQLKCGNNVKSATCTHVGVNIWMDTEDENWANAVDSPKEEGEDARRRLMELWASEENLKLLSGEASANATDMQTNPPKLFILNPGSQEEGQSCDKEFVIATLKGRTPLERFVRVLQRLHGKGICIQQGIYTPQVAQVMITTWDGENWLDHLSPFVDL